MNMGDVGKQYECEILDRTYAEIRKLVETQVVVIRRTIIQQETFNAYSKALLVAACVTKVDPNDPKRFIITTLDPTNHFEEIVFTAASENDYPVRRE